MVIQCFPSRLFEDIYSIASAAIIWNARGLPDHPFLSSAVIPPLNNATSRSFTNAAYLQLLKVRTNAGRKPIKYYIGFGGTVLSPLPVDRSLSNIIRNDPHKKMIAGLKFGQANIRRYIFCSPVASVEDKVKFDALDVIAASLYTEGKFDTNKEDPFSHQEMTLELSLNVVAFHRRCAHFTFLSPLLVNWSILAIQ
jgi:hypothetical protein